MHGTRVVLVQARDVGAAIVDERGSQRGSADPGYPIEPFRRDFAIGRAVPYAFQNAPCAVWVVREPMGEESEMRS